MSRFVFQESIMGLGRQTSSVYIKAIEGTKSSLAQELNKFILPKGALKTLNSPSKLIDSKRNNVSITGKRNI